MRVLAIDLGATRVGLAVSDDLGMLAHPRPTLDGRNTGRLIDAICAFAKSQSVDRFLVGLPRHLDGREGVKARAARRFAARLSERSGVHVDLVDERWTTVEASSRLRDQGLNSKQIRSRVDSASAAVMLQSWLETHRAAEP